MADHLNNSGLPTTTYRSSNTGQRPVPLIISPDDAGEQSGRPFSFDQPQEALARLGRVPFQFGEELGPRFVAEPTRQLLHFAHVARNGIERTIVDDAQSALHAQQEIVTRS